MSLASGTRLGPYEIRSAIGAGGMGEVYKARDTRLGRTVAIKVLPGHLAADPERLRRFEQEARAVSALNHPHICVLHDVGSQDGVAFLVMEHLDGQTLAHRLRKGAMPLDEVLECGAQIADALAAAHRQGIVHRDLKPGNIMLTKAGVKLLDFGLAKLRPKMAAPGAGLSALSTQAPATTPGAVMGTVPYMAPEQLEGKEADARTDLFAFGCVLYEMLTGRRAFAGETEASVISAIMTGQPPPLEHAAARDAAGARAPGAPVPSEGPGRALAARGGRGRRVARHLAGLGRTGTGSHGPTKRAARVEARRRCRFRRLRCGRGRLGRVRPPLASLPRAGTLRPDPAGEYGLRQDRRADHRRGRRREWRRVSGV